MAKIPKAVMSYCMRTVHKQCGSPKSHRKCASDFLKKCIRARRTSKKH